MRETNEQQPYKKKKETPRVADFQFTLTVRRQERFINNKKSPVCFEKKIVPLYPVYASTMVR
jgi:hypothetical protein